MAAWRRATDLALRRLMFFQDQHSLVKPQILNRNNGFALLSVVMLVAVISLMSLSLAKLVLTNTEATSVEHQRVKAEQLMIAGLRFAALSLASPRDKVSASAIPARNLTYSSPDADVLMKIENESGFIDLLSAEKALLEEALLTYGASKKELPTLLNLLAGLNSSEQRINAAEPSINAKPNYRQKSYRRLRNALRSTTVKSSELLAVTTLHNGQKGIHPALASEQVLNLVPLLSKAERDRVLSQRDNDRPRLISNAVTNTHFISRISPYYRIKCSVVLYEHVYTQTFIIKMTNQTGRLFEIQARL